MGNSHHIQGWKIHHQEQLIYRANAGSPTIRLKFFQYPNYRQTVRINNFPLHCKVRKKGINSFFLFQKKVRTKGKISLDRSISVFPITSFVNLKEEWGKISSIPNILKKKYRESSKFWPVKSPTILNVSEQEWFSTDDVSRWVQLTCQYIREKIKYRENQEERLGAYQAFLTATGDCDEFTDLFITLARMRGIPCRRLIGYFIANQGDKVEAHAWGEILSPEVGWITIDIALNNLGNHSVHYVILKIEEFNPSLPNYQIHSKHDSTVHYDWQLSKPIFTPIY